MPTKPVVYDVSQPPHELSDGELEGIRRVFAAAPDMTPPLLHSLVMTVEKRDATIKQSAQALSAIEYGLRTVREDMRERLQTAARYRHEHLDCGRYYASVAQAHEIAKTAGASGQNMMRLLVQLFENARELQACDGSEGVYNAARNSLAVVRRQEIIAELQAQETSDTKRIMSDVQEE